MENVKESNKDKLDRLITLMNLARVDIMAINHTVKKLEDDIDTIKQIVKFKQDDLKKKEPISSGWFY